MPSDINDISDLKISEYQKLIKKLVVERGFDKETVTEVFTLFIEETGELAKAIRKQNGQKIDINSKKHDVEEEAADVFWLLLDLCNRLGINLGQAIHLKEIKNTNRHWQ